LAEIEAGERWFLTAKGVSLAKLITSERKPFEKAYYLTSYDHGLS
jgi:hypothetical protein